ncbi:MAG: AmmeMemoRadiSam system radical SAM enzyme [archaeon]|jgi:pyruvate formate lyase activating enzyme
MISKYFEKLNDNTIKCTACYRACVITEGKTGFCNVRKNENGKLISLVYGKPISICIDPIEKKPLYHFFPGTKTLSLGTPGCNFDCSFCQNHTISNCKNINLEKQNFVSPKEIIALAKENKTPSISYTYTEPTIFVEYALDIMKLAKKEGIKNVWVSNGYMSKPVLKDIIPYLDAINVDLKGTQELYDQLIPGIDVKKIKSNIKTLYKNKVHIEITNLLIEGYNTTSKQMQETIDFVYSVSPEIPLHFSRAFPYYKLKTIIPTKLETLKLAEKLAKEKGLKNVYLENIY